MHALAGLVVLDVTQVMAGPTAPCTSPTWAPTSSRSSLRRVTRREAGATRAPAPTAPRFNAVNRGKRSIVLDLKTDAARESSAASLGRADIVIENFRPGVMGGARPRLRVAVSAGNPRLIYASISGYGQTGPRRA